MDTNNITPPVNSNHSSGFAGVAIAIGPAVAGILINAAINGITSWRMYKMQEKKQDEMIAAQREVAEKNYAIAKHEAEIAVSQCVHDLYELTKELKENNGDECRTDDK